MTQYLLPGFTIAFFPPDEPALDAPAVVRFSDALLAARGALAQVGPETCAALIVGAALDPEVAALRDVARVPLIAPGEASLSLARALGSRLSIIVLDDHNAGLAAAMVAQTTIRPSIASIRSVDLSVRTILTEPDSGREALWREATAAVREDGADVIYLGAMSLGTLDPPTLRQALGVPVIDPLPVALLAAQGIVLAR